jgi:1-phosphatidylinositol-4-phosphate 5-kinase
MYKSFPNECHEHLMDKRTFRINHHFDQQHLALVFCRQIERDAKFLESERIMDYSLLMGVHFQGAGERIEDTLGSIVDGHGALPGIHMQAQAEPQLRSQLRSQLKPQLKPQLTPQFKLQSADAGSPASDSARSVVLCCGIIDILQRYDMGKRLEHAYKSIHFDPLSISAIDPAHYSKRFRDFIDVVFLRRS